jgi:LPXTG-motif cell wall-anchored protein
MGTAADLLVIAGIILLILFLVWLGRRRPEPAWASFWPRDATAPESPVAEPKAVEPSD